MVQEPKAKRATPWYTDKTELYGAMARAFGGYQGKVEQRWHVIPIALVKPFAKVAGLATPKVKYIDKLICRMHKQCLFGPLDDYVYSILRYIAYDVVDATGAVFPFEMVYSHGDPNGNTGFFAMVWNRNTSKKVAHCCDAHGCTSIHWKDKSLIQRYVPHGGLFPDAVKDNFVYDEGSRFFQEIRSSHNGIETTNPSGKNELELMIAVAGELTRRENIMFYPREVPDDVLTEAKKYLFGKLIARLTSDVLEVIWSYIAWRLFFDQDIDFPPPHDERDEDEDYGNSDDNEDDDDEDCDEDNDKEEDNSGSDDDEDDENEDED